MNENKKIISYDPMTGQPIDENHEQYQNNINSQNNVIPQNNMMPQNNVIPQNNMMSQNNMMPQNNVMPQNNMIAQNNMVPKAMPLNNTNYNNKLKNKKSLIFLIIGILLTVVALYQFVFNKGYDTNRTIMIYLLGSNLETESGMATLDVKEIENSGIDLKENNVVVYAGGSKNWDNEFENNSIYELTEDGFKLIKSDSKMSMGNSQTLSNFLNYVTDNYKSKSYGLILWDHGSGPILGYGVDEVYDNDVMLLTELKEALNESDFSKKNKLEFIGFDACLMASIEVASVISDYSNYMIASQDVEPGYGWDYTFLSKVNKSVSTEELGTMIVDYMHSYYEELSDRMYGRYTFYTTLSLLDLSKIEKLEEDLNDLFEDVDVALLNNGYSRIVSKITKAKPFGYSGAEQSFDLVDLTEVSEQLIDDYGDKAKKLKNSIDDVVIYQKTNVAGANGLSIYYPYHTKSYLDKFLKIYKSLDFAEEYTDFLFNYSEILSGKKLYDFNLKSTMPQLSNDTDSISASLSNDIVSNYNNANYIIFRDMKNGYHMPVYKSSNVTLEQDGTIKANFDRKQLSVKNENNESGWATLFEYTKTDSYVIYNIPIIMYKTGTDIGSSEIDNAYVQLLVDANHPNGTVINVVPLNDVNDTTSIKKIINLEEWDYIQFFNSEYKLYDESGNFTDNWESSGIYYLAEVDTDENYVVEFVELDNEYDYYCLFQINDTQGNKHYTNMVKID